MADVRELNRDGSSDGQRSWQGARTQKMTVEEAWKQRIDRAEEGRRKDLAMIASALECAIFDPTQPIDEIAPELCKIITEARAKTLPVPAAPPVPAATPQNNGKRK